MTLDSDEEPTHPDYYPQIMFKGKRYAMVPELVDRAEDDKTSRCEGCAFYNPSGTAHCKDYLHTLEARGAPCDIEGNPLIFVDTDAWNEYLVARVARRLETAQT